MKVNSNIQGMIAQSILSRNETKMAKSTEKMSSGYKLNKAMDNPAGMAISNRMRAQLKGLDRANKNSKNAINAVQTAEGGMAEIEAMLQRMNELAIQGSNGTLTDEDRNAVHEEVNQLVSEIERISKNTTYNTQGLLDGSQNLKGYSDKPDTLTVREYNEIFPQGKFAISLDADGVPTAMSTDTTPSNPVDISSYDITVFKDDSGNVTGTSTKIYTRDGGELTVDKKTAAVATDIKIDLAGIGGMKVQTGAEEGQEIQVVIPEVSLKTLNFVDHNGNRTLNLRTEDGAKNAIEWINKAIDTVSAARSKVGAYQNRIEKTISNLDVSTENLTGSLSTIKDIDMAEGMVEYTTLQVLIQAGTTMLAQANEQPQQALQLLQ